MEPIVTKEIWYVQKGKHGFYSDSEWDGDCFSSDPMYAEKRKEPWLEGRGPYMYKCVQVEITTWNYGPHEPPVLCEVNTCRRGIPKIKYKMKCPRCGVSTKTYALAKTPVKAYENLGSCIITKWREIDG
jgi:hypothetical protein